MITPNDKEKFLTELEQTPFPSIACKRVGISKATIYRWRKEDTKFRKDMDDAMEAGRETITESAEAHTVMLIKKGEFRAIRLWLENNTTRYYKPKKAIPAPRTERIISTVNVHIVDENGKPLQSAKPTNPKGAPDKPRIVHLK
jgi:hypothetical protein